MTCKQNIFSLLFKFAPAQTRISSSVKSGSHLAAFSNLDWISLSQCQVHSSRSFSSDTNKWNVMVLFTLYLYFQLWEGGKSWKAKALSVFFSVHCIKKPRWTWVDVATDLLHVQVSSLRRRWLSLSVVSVYEPKQLTALCCQCSKAGKPASQKYHFHHDNITLCNGFVISVVAYNFSFISSIEQHNRH